MELSIMGVSHDTFRPSLSIVVVTTNANDRMSLLLEALSRQSRAGELEVIVIGIAAAKPVIHFPQGLDVSVITHPQSYDLGRARGEGVRHARAPVIAFLEDHTVPEPGWAEQVCNAFSASARVTAVSYAFSNGSPDTYFYRSVFMAEYGALAHPLPKGEVPAMAANNVAYRRDALMAVGDRLDSLIEIDFFLQKAMGSSFQILAAPLALVAHQTNRRFFDLIRGHFIYAQIFALRRVRFESWSFPKRLAATAAIPVLVPWLRIRRLYKALAGGPNLAVAIKGFPVILTLYLAGALGEAWGLIRREESPLERLVWLELESERIAR
jgi:hypothetical protein